MYRQGKITVICVLTLTVLGYTTPEHQLAASRRPQEFTQSSLNDHHYPTKCFSSCIFSPSPKSAQPPLSRSFQTLKNHGISEDDSSATMILISEEKPSKAVFGSSATTFHHYTSLNNLSNQIATSSYNSSNEQSIIKLLSSALWSADIQQRIYQDVCSCDVEMFCALMATAKVESEFEVTMIGDQGESFGPFQIQPKWHKARMERHNVTIEDLHDPVKSAAVALDLFEELIASNDYSGYCIEVSIIYNAGHYTRNESAVSYANKVFDQYQQYLAEFSQTTITTAN